MGKSQLEIFQRNNVDIVGIANNVRFGIAGRNSYVNNRNSLN
jgi:hypothetical protein